MRSPIIGISANLFAAEPRSSYNGKALQLADNSMIKRLRAAGGFPIILPISTVPDELDQQASLIDGLVLTGGADIDPSSYGQAPRGWTGQPERDAFELGLVRRVRARERPVLGICRGHQLLNVAFGGTLLHDIATEYPRAEIHRDDARYDDFRHRVRLAEDTMLSELLGGTDVEVNSVHHQAVDRVGDGLVPVAWSADGLIEGLHAPADFWTWSVQWHPEWDPRAEHLALFERFVARSRS